MHIFNEDRYSINNYAIVIFLYIIEDVMCSVYDYSNEMHKRHEFRVSIILSRLHYLNIK